MADLQGVRRRWTRGQALSCASVLVCAASLVSMPSAATAFETRAEAAPDRADTTPVGIDASDADQPWLSFVLGYLPVATAALTQTAPSRGGRVPDCRPGPGCIVPPIRFPLQSTRDVPFGPIQRHGWALFTAFGDRRLYTYPSTAKDGGGSRADAWEWGIGAQFDAQALTGGGPSSRSQFLVGEFGAGDGGGDDGSDGDAKYELRARLVVGGDALGPMITASGVFGIGIDDPTSPVPAGFRFGAKLEMRF